MTLAVCFAGEGPNEIGDGYPGAERPGVLQAMLTWRIGDAWHERGRVVWKSLRKYQAGRGRTPTQTTGHADEGNVAKLVQRAFVEHECDALVFSRDLDNDDARDRAIEQGIRAAQTKWPTKVIVGGGARRALESWLLAMHGDRDSEQRSIDAATAALRDRGLRSTSDYVAFVAELDAAHAPPADAATLHRWLDRARQLAPGEAP